MWRANEPDAKITLEVDGHRLAAYPVMRDVHERNRMSSSRHGLS